MSITITYKEDRLPNGDIMCRACIDDGTRSYTDALTITRAEAGVEFLPSMLKRRVLHNVLDGAINGDML